MKKDSSLTRAVLTEVIIRSFDNYACNGLGLSQQDVERLKNIIWSKSRTKANNTLFLEINILEKYHKY